MKRRIEKTVVTLLVFILCSSILISVNLIKISPVRGSIFQNTWGGYGNGDGQFNGPAGVAVNSSGYVYVTDFHNSRVEVFDSSGNFRAQFSNFNDFSFFEPNSIAINSSGYVYVADSGNNRIEVFDGNNNFVTMWGGYGNGGGQFDSPIGIAVNGSGYVYVADENNQRIQVFDSNGNFVNTWGSQGSGHGLFNYPFDVAVDSSGYVYVADGYNNRIQKFDSSGNFITQWGSQGSSNGEFYYPVGVAVDSAGYVYVADSYNCRVEKFNNSGNFVTSLGNNGTGDGQFNYPYQIAINNYGSLFVTDIVNNRVVEFQLSATYGPLASFVSTGSVSTPVVGQPFSIYLTAVDQYGNVITGYGGTINFTSSDTQAVLPSNYTFLPADMGTHNFPLTLNTVGPHWITVTDSAAGVSSTSDFDVAGLTINNWVEGGVPGSDWNYIITSVNSPSTVIENFTLPAGGGNITFSDIVFTNGGDFIVTETSKFGYGTDVSAQTFDDSYVVIGDYSATIYLIFDSAMIVTFNNTAQGAFAGQYIGMAAPVGENFPIPVNQPYPIQAAWNVTLKADGRFDLVVNKTMAILVNFTTALQSGQSVTVQVTFNGTTYSQVVQQIALAANTVISFYPIVPNYTGNFTITGTYQISGSSQNTLTSTQVTVKDTMILPLYYYTLTNSNYGSISPSNYNIMAGNTTVFINATYPVKNVTTNMSSTSIAGAAQSNSPNKFQGIINDCVVVSVQAALSSYGTTTRGIGIAPNNTGLPDYFTYQGAPGGAGFTSNPNTHGVIVLDGYYTAAAHEVGHTFSLYYGKNGPEEYLRYPWNNTSGMPTSGVWPGMGQWRTGIDIMGLAPYRTLNYTWIASSTYNNLFALTRASQTDPEVLVASGLIYNNGTVVMPQTWYHLQTGIPDDIVPGNFSLQFLDANGHNITAVSFDAPFSVNIDPGASVGQNAVDLSGFGDISTNVTSFAFIVPYVQGTAQIQIVNNTDPQNPIVMTTVSAASIVYVPPPTVNITFNSSGVGNDANGATVMSIDGTPYTYNQLQTPSFNWQPGTTHTVTVSSTVAAGSGKQYSFSNWTNGNGLTTGTSTYTVPNTDTVVTANFKTQYYLSVVTSPAEVAGLASGVVSGSGWYDSGATATVNTLQDVIKVAGSYRYDFQTWTGVTSSGPGNKASVVMSSAKTATANYQVQYGLIVATNPPGLTPQPIVMPSGAGVGWYNPNTHVTLFALPIANYALNNWYTFDYWTKDGTSNIRAMLTTIKMDQPHTMIANYAHFTMNGYFTDSDFNPISSFDCFTAPGGGPSFKLTAANPATFYYNLQVTNNEPAGTFTFYVVVPSDFGLKPLTPSVSPVQVDGKSVPYTLSKLGLLTVSNVKINQGQMVTLSVHLNYTNKNSNHATFSKTYPFVATIGITQATVTSITANGKTSTAIGGFITDKNGAPKGGLTVTATTSTGTIAATGTSTSDGFYFMTIPAGTYTLTIRNSLNTQLAQVKNVKVAQNQFVEQDFTLSAADVAISGSVKDNNGNSVSGATVQFLSGTNVLATTSTNLGGYYVFRFNQPGQYTIQATAPSGYSPPTKSAALSVNLGDSPNVNFILTKN